jgi:hypothetical protein
MISFARWRAVIFSRLGEKIKGKMIFGGFRLSFLLVILILLLIFSPGSDHEQDQDHEQERSRGAVVL